jgi:hypothetical protein
MWHTSHHYSKKMIRVVIDLAYWAYLVEWYTVYVMNRCKVTEFVNPNQQCHYSVEEHGCFTHQIIDLALSFLGTSSHFRIVHSYS